MNKENFHHELLLKYYVDHIPAVSYLLGSEYEKLEPEDISCIIQQILIDYGGNR